VRILAKLVEFIGRLWNKASNNATNVGITQVNMG
jgi:hypothetical protein